MIERLHRLESRRTLIGLLLVALGVLVGCGPHPDVIFITVDTLRLDHVSAFNPTSPVKTPNIDALAADGVSFTEAWSPISVTGPAFATLHTGLDPAKTGVVMNHFRGGTSLDPKVRTLAESMRERNYRTAAFVSGFTLRRAVGLDQGFQVYQAPPAGHRSIPGAVTTDEAINWLRQVKGGVFLWVHLYDVHGPLAVWHVDGGPTNPKRGGPDLSHIAGYQRVEDISDPAWYEARYQHAVAYVDRQVGRLVAALKQMGRYDDAVIVFTADHGESFTERELWFDHGTTAYAEQLHIPLVIKLPGQARAGTRDDHMVGLADVAPTVVALAHVPRLWGADGVSLFGAHHRPVLVGESSHCKLAPVLSCRPRGPGGKLFAARDPRWTLAFAPVEGGEHWELFDRATDPAELVPLPATNASPALRRAILQARQKRAAMHLPDPNTVGSEHDPEMQALKALGYVE